MTASPVNNNPNAYYALLNYKSSGDYNKGDLGKTQRVPSEGVQAPKGPEYRATTSQEVNEVGKIGLAKKAAFENGLGGTSTPVDANGRACRTWVA